MKKVTFITMMLPALLLAMASLSGCNKTNTPDNIEKNIEIKNFQHSDCLNGTQNVPALNDDYSFNQEITFTSQNSLLHVELSNILMNCCLDSIDYEISIDEGNIIINLKPILIDGGCNCVCHFNLDFDIANLVFGSYVVKIQFDGQQLYDDINLIYDSNTNQTDPLIMN